MKLFFEVFDNTHLFKTILNPLPYNEFACINFFPSMKSNLRVRPLVESALYQTSLAPAINVRPLLKIIYHLRGWLCCFSFHLHTSAIPSTLLHNTGQQLSHSFSCTDKKGLCKICSQRSIFYAAVFFQRLAGRFIDRPVSLHGGTKVSRTSVDLCSTLHCSVTLPALWFRLASATDGSLMLKAEVGTSFHKATQTMESVCQYVPGLS